MAQVLLIDDDDLARFAICEVLKRAGHSVTQAKNGKVGLSAQTATDFDIIITDIIMPEVEGIEVIVKLKEQSPKIPVIAISGGGRISKVDYLEIASSLGADGTLAKPFSEDELNEKISECLVEL